VMPALVPSAAAAPIQPQGSAAVRYATPPPNSPAERPYAGAIWAPLSSADTTN
jgi:hypothetical protein